MKIEKRGPCSYRIRKTYDKKTYSVSVDHKPTEAEAEKLIMRQISMLRASAIQKKALTLSFKESADGMIEDKRNVLSPSTIRDYKGRLSRLSDVFTSLPISEITQQDVQREINRLAGKYSGKNVSNYYGFISSVFSYCRPEMVLKINLPAIKRKEPYVPNSDEINKVIDAASGTAFELAVLLACLSLRRGEICALTMDDVDFKHKTISITKDMVQNENQEWVIKPTPKTDASNRIIAVDDRILNLIKERGLYSMHPGYITSWMLETEDKLNLPRFSIHKLRHYFASSTHDKGFTDKQIISQGGWSTDYVMKKVYRHKMSERNKEMSASLLNDLH